MGDASAHRREFIDRAANLGGASAKLAAIRAMSMDLDPNDCICFQLYDHRGKHPTLHFEAKGRPHVTIVVSAGGALRTRAGALMGGKTTRRVLLCAAAALPAIAAAAPTLAQPSPDAAEWDRQSPHFGR